MALTKRQDAELLRFSPGVMRMDGIGNEHIRGTAHMGQFGDNVNDACAKEKQRLCWEESVKDGAIRQEEKRRTNRKRRFMDVVMKDMRVVGVKEDDAEDKAKWR